MKNAAQPLPFGPGDRLSDFLLDDQDGVPFLFSGAADGRPSLVAFTGRDDGTMLARLAARQQALATAGISVIAVTAASPCANRQQAAETGAAFPILSDPEERYLRAYRAATGQRTGPVIFLADANQRVAAMPDSTDPAGSALAALAELGDMHLPAPVLFVPRVLDAETCSELIALWQTRHEAIGYSTPDGDAVDETAKSSLDHVIRDPLMNDRLTNLLARRLGPEIRRAFGIRDELAFEVFIVLGYDADRRDFFGPHRDDVGERMQHRRIAVSINLNEDYTGGELHFPEYGPARHGFAAGTAAIFGCSVLHQALPPATGRRYVLTTFLCDPE
jgi:peroxiredoxin/predicted 2-oxoglutarate/Fe(II)-dependent dioxygenase YbiX